MPRANGNTPRRTRGMRRRLRAEAVKVAAAHAAGKVKRLPGRRRPDDE